MTTAPLGVGIVGTGNISMTYMRNAALFPGVRLVACADSRPSRRGRGRRSTASAPCPRMRSSPTPRSILS